ncbi:isocitrate/isopropylmalate dehydrogenase [Cenarchaeum symbiosum A]|uniref:Isocitrate/isopropylmalate dehydrogenase n=1 Tax=Cenarchaeum symbiosum (strain A) TaxID=414004 RepID=A0RV78_CENSY|nr:isocitrate/isopropylmalate dehydrogenase [Cenarchaeum symbiosum A]
MYRIALIEGDGIGPEISRSVTDVLGALKEPKLSIERFDAGDRALKEHGTALPPETIRGVEESDACLKAPVGESAADVIVALRRRLDLYANVRPAKSHPGMPAIRDDIDLLIARENTEDLYTGNEFFIDGAAVALRTITERASERIARYALKAAMTRRRKVTCVHKANVMRVTDGLFASTCRRVAAEYPDVEFGEMYVDACAMNLIRRPEWFDVIVTTNLFGDILSDESSQAAGGLGMAPAGNIGDKFAIFEPVHGAAFDIAGKNEANPSSFLLSAAMMLGWLGGRNDDATCLVAATRLNAAVYGAVKEGIKTKDMGGSAGTDKFTAEIISRL